jgi:hypothetical protein
VCPLYISTRIIVLVDIYYFHLYIKYIIYYFLKGVSYNIMNVPYFLKLENNALLFNLDNSEFLFYIDEEFFNDTTKNPIAQIDGEYVTTIGLCNWSIVDNKGKTTKPKLFSFPTMVMCKPYTIEKVKDYKLNETSEPSNYRILRFRKGDEVISQTMVPKLLDNVELFYKLSVISAKIPEGISYDEGWKLFLENMELNGSSYKLSAQLFGILWSAICRDPKDITRPFRYTKMENMNAYKPISIKMVPKFISPYASIVSEGFDESLMSAIMLSDEKEENIKNSPLEKVIMQ